MEPRQASPEARNVEKTQKDIPMEPRQASPEAGNVEKTSGRRTSCVVRQRQLCGSRGTPACAGQPGLLIRWVKRTT